MSNNISATQASQAADEIIRLAGVIKNYAAKLNGEQPATDPSPAINSAMKRDEQFREAGDEAVIKAAFAEIAKIATESGESVVPDDVIVKAEPIGGTSTIEPPIADGDTNPA